MRKVVCKLDTAIAGIGFVLRRSPRIAGELDENGIVWVEVEGTHRIPGEAVARRRIGVSVAKFAYIEDPVSAPPAVDKRTEVNQQIRAAEKAARDAKTSKARA